METTRVQRQNKVYDYIVECIQGKGYAPTLREICQELNIKSTSSVHSDLKRLQERGLLDVVDGEPRAIQVIGYKFVKI